MKEKIDILVKRGLTANEAIEFLSLVNKITLSEKDKEDLEQDWNNGEMGFGECITQLTIINLRK